MNCTKVRRLTSDKMDVLLPQKLERQFDKHLDECAKCSLETEAMFDTRILLKSIYPDSKAPEGFSLRVMDEIRSKAYVRPFTLPAWFARSYKPVAALALSASLIVGLFAFNKIPDVTVVPAEETPIYENGDVIDEPVILPEPEPNDNNQLAEAKPIEPSDVIKAEDIQIVRQEVETPVAQEPSLDTDEPVVTLEAVEVTGEQDKPILIDTVPVSLPEPVALNGNENDADKTPDPKTVKSLEAQSFTVTFNEADIPDPSVFVRRKRIIESETIRLSVQRIDKALSQIEDRAEFFRLKPDITITNIRDDGTIVVMKSYSVSSGLANIFKNHLATFGTIIERDSHRLDVTSEYSNMLDEHKALLEEVLKTGDKTQQLRDLVKELMFFERMSQPGMKSVTVWLEDGVDF